MKITFEFDSTKNSPIAIQQLIDWGIRLEAGSTGENVSAPKVASAVSPKTQTERELFNKLVDGATGKPVEEPVGEVISDEQENGQIAEQPAAGALPPGVEAPSKRRGGRPSKADIAAREAAAAAAAPNPAMPSTQPVANGAVPPGVGGGGARPPGVGSPPPPPPQSQVAQPQVAAMPPQEGYSSGMVSKEDLRAIHAEASAHDTKGVFAMMMSDTWPDQTNKPKWFSIDRVVPQYYDQLFAELNAFLPMEG